MTKSAPYPDNLPAARWNTFAPALRSPNFRLFWFAQSLSMVGTSLQVVAEGWLIYNMTQSTFWLGMVSFIALLPAIPISLMGGVLIDRVPRRKLILATQCGLMAQAAVFAVLGLTNRLQLWHIIILYFVFGALLAIDHPARRAFLVELVDRDKLANAVALNATSFNVASVVGYALSGLLIAVIGAGGTMLINAATYLAPIWALATIRLPDVIPDMEGRPLRTAIWEGVVAMWRQPNIISVMALLGVVGGLAWPVYSMMPAFAQDVLGTSAVGLGLLMASGALGSVIGIGLVARLGNHHRGRTLAAASMLVPLLVIAFATSRSVVVACVFMVALGLVLLVLESISITLVQVHTPDRVRGRVMSLFSQLHAGSTTAGNAFIGTVAVLVGLPVALGLGGLAALLFALCLRVAVPSVRRLD